MSEQVENKIQGISGRNKLCVLQPFKVLEVIGAEPPEEPTPPPQDPPEEPTPPPQDPVEEPNEPSMDEKINAAFNEFISSINKNIIELRENIKNIK